MRPHYFIDLALIECFYVESDKIGASSARKVLLAKQQRRHSRAILIEDFSKDWQAIAKDISQLKLANYG